jgi:multiple sugar transport system permease protein
MLSFRRRETLYGWIFILPAIGILGLKGALGARDTAHLMMAMSTLMVLPIVLIFFVAQRAFIQGIVLTGLKG